MTDQAFFRPTAQRLVGNAQGLGRSAGRQQLLRGGHAAKFREYLELSQDPSYPQLLPNCGKSLTVWVMPAPQPARREKWVPQDTFANRLVLLRRELGLTQLQAAEACGLDDGSWSNWENGTKCRDLAEIVKKISEALGVDRDWLMWGSTSLRKVYGNDPQLALVWAQDKPDGRFSPRQDRPLMQLVPSPEE